MNNKEIIMVEMWDKRLYTERWYHIAWDCKNDIWYLDGEEVSNGMDSK